MQVCTPLKCLHDEFGIVGKDLPTFMHCRAAVRLDNEQFWKFMKRLRVACAIAGQDLPSFIAVCGKCVANEVLVSGLYVACEWYVSVREWRVRGE